MRRAEMVQYHSQNEIFNTIFLNVIMMLLRTKLHWKCVMRMRWDKMTKYIYKNSHNNWNNIFYLSKNLLLCS